MDIFSIFCNIKVCCVFSLESPHRGDSNEYTQYTIFNLERETHPKLSYICSYVIYSRGLKNEFEIAVVNEPPVFEPLKVYCTSDSNCAYQIAYSLVGTREKLTIIDQSQLWMSRPGPVVVKMYA